MSDTKSTEQLMSLLPNLLRLASAQHAFLLEFEEEDLRSEACFAEDEKVLEITRAIVEEAQLSTILEACPSVTPLHLAGFSNGGEMTNTVIAHGKNEVEIASYPPAVNGDGYIDTASGNVYTKTSGTWGPEQLTVCPPSRSSHQPSSDETVVEPKSSRFFNIRRFWYAPANRSPECIGIRFEEIAIRRHRSPSAGPSIKMSIDDIEKLLNSEDSVSIEILPNGEVCRLNNDVSRSETGVKLLTLKEHLGGEYAESGLIHWTRQGMTAIEGRQPLTQGISTIEDMESLPLTKGINRLDWVREGLILKVSETIHAEVQRQGITLTEVGRRMKVGKAHISRLLDGTRNMTIRSLAELVEALGCEVDIQLRPTRIQSSSLTDDELKASQALHGFVAWDARLRTIDCESIIMVLKREGFQISKLPSSDV